jgi:protein SCO1/2
MQKIVSLSHRCGAAIRLLAAGVAIASTMWLTACPEDVPPFVGIDITGANYAQDFTLTDHNGQRRTLADFKGKAVVIFFGFTQCPDVCPTSMSEMAEAKALLGPLGDRFQGLFLTVDPERDTPVVMAEYVSHFDPTFLALYADPGELKQVAADFKVYYRRVEGPTATSYTIDHWAGSYVYDANGQLRLYHRYNTGAAGLASDIKRLLTEN